MSNALVKPSRTEVAQHSATDPFAAAAASMAGSAAVYMKFNGNSGEFTIGAEADEVPEGTSLATDMSVFRQGWICWKDSEVVDEFMAIIANGQQPKQEDELPDHGPYVQNDDQNDGWQQQASVVFRNLKTGEEYTFKTSSKSAYRALGALLKDYSRQYKMHPGQVPIVEIGSKQFTVKNKKWGKKYAPVFKIVKWVDEAELIAQVDGESAEDYEQDAAPVQTPAIQQQQQPAAPAPAAEPAPAPQPEPPPAPVTQAAPAPAAAPQEGKPVPQRGARRRSF